MLRQILLFAVDRDRYVVLPGSELTLASNDEHEVALDALYSLFYDEDEESLDSSSLKDTDDSSSSHDAAEEGKPSSFPKEAVEKPTRSRPWKVPHPRVQPLTSTSKSPSKSPSESPVEASTTTSSTTISSTTTTNHYQGDQVSHPFTYSSSCSFANSSRPSQLVVNSCVAIPQSELPAGKWATNDVECSKCEGPNPYQWWPCDVELCDCSGKTPPVTNNCLAQTNVCGPDDPCPNNACCSQYGYCGVSEDHCGECCQSGNCLPFLIYHYSDGAQVKRQICNEVRE